jgi:hypothetical protein
LEQTLPPFPAARPAAMKRTFLFSIYWFIFAASLLPYASIRSRMSVALIKEVYIHLFGAPIWFF